MNTLTNKNDDDESEVKEGYYYWGYFNDTFKLIKITTVSQKEIHFRENKIKYEYLKDGLRQVQLIDSNSESKMLTKDKNLLKKFEINQINPYSEDLASISSVCYPSLLYNLKLKDEHDIHFTRAGKLLIGINFNKLKKSDVVNYNILSKFTSSIADNITYNNQTLIINGLPNTGKSNIMKTILREFFSLNENENQKNILNTSSFNSNNTEEISKNYINKADILNYLIKSIQFLEIFGNTVESGSNSNINSSRYMRVIKFQKLKNLLNNNKLVKIKVKHYLFEKSRILDSFNTYYSHENKEDKDNKEIKNNFHIFHALISGLYMIFYKNLFSENQNKHQDYDEIIKIIKSEFKFLKENGILEELYIDYSRYFIEYQDYYLEKFLQLIDLIIGLKILHRKIIKKIFNVVLSVLLLLKIEFEVNEDGKALLDENNIYINLLSNLLDCELNTIRTKLISREIRSPRGSFYVVKFTLEEANRVRDTFAKYLYENLFEYMTRFMNTLINEELRKEILLISSQDEYLKSFKKLKQDNQLKTYLVVECFGFENSENAMKNSLENLCVNYTNDKLNNLLFDILIKGETELYKQQGLLTDNSAMILKLEKPKENRQQTQVNISDETKSSSTRKSVTNSNRPRGALKMNFNTNNGMLDMDIEETLLALDDQNKGIFKLIDVQGSLINTNKGAIKSLCDNIKLNWPNLLTTNSSFFLVHFGSVVEYGASDFIFKNVDTVNQDLKEVSNKFFKKFTNYLLNIQNYPKDVYSKYLLKIVSKDENSTTSNQARNSAVRRMSQNFKLNSNTEKYLISLKKLLADISNSNVNFIKLINSAVNIENYDDKFILKQIYSSGIFESIMLAKGGFYLRHNYEELFNILIKYQVFFKDVVKEDHVKFINKFSKLLNIDSSDIIIGKTIIFVKNNAVEKNKSLLNCNYLPSYAIICALKILLRKIIKLSRVVKIFINVGKKGSIRIFTNTLQNIMNNWHKRYIILILKNGFQVIRSRINLIIKIVRRYLTSKKISRIIENNYAEKIQKFFKNYKCNKEIIFHTKSSSVLKIQEKFRNYSTNKIIHSLVIQNKARKIQHIFRNFICNKKINSLIQLKSIKKIQQNFKNFLLHKKMCSHFTNNQVIKIQNKFRKFIMYKKKDIYTKINCSIKIQKYYKKFLGNRKINLIKKQNSFIKLQNKFKEYIWCRKIKQIKQNNNALKIQHTFSKYIIKKKINHKYKNYAALKIQRVLKLNFLLNLIKRRILLQKTLKIQNYFKNYMTKSKLKLILNINSVKKIQKYFRLYIRKKLSQMKKQKEEYQIYVSNKRKNELKLKNNALIIQKRFRIFIKENKKIDFIRLINNFYKKFNNRMMKKYIIKLNIFSKIKIRSIYLIQKQYRIYKNIIACDNEIKFKIKEKLYDLVTKLYQCFNIHDLKVGLNSLKLNRNLIKKIEATNKIMKFYIKYKLLSKEKEGKSKIYLNECKHLIDLIKKIILSKIILKIRNFAFKKLLSVKLIQTFYRIHIINRNLKIKTLFETLEKVLKNLFRKKFYTNISYINKLTKFENILCKKFDQLKNYSFSKLVFFLKINSYLNNKAALKILNFFKFIKFDREEKLRQLINRLKIKIVVKDIKNSSLFLKSLKQNYDLDKSDEIFTVNFGELTVIDNYVEKNENNGKISKLSPAVSLKILTPRGIESGKKLDFSSASKHNSNEKIIPRLSAKPYINPRNLMKNSLTEHKPVCSKYQKDVNKTILSKSSSNSSLCAANFKPRVSHTSFTQRPPIIRPSSKSKKSITLTPVMNLEIDTNKCKPILPLNEKKQTISSMKNLNKKIQDEFSKNRKFDKLMENCANELDDLMKDISKDLEKLKNDKIDIGVDYGQLNREKKRRQSVKLIPSGSSDDQTQVGMNAINTGKPTTRHSHNHQSININGNYDHVTFKRVCLADQLKK